MRKFQRVPVWIVVAALLTLTATRCVGSDATLLSAAHAFNAPDYLIFPAYYSGWDADDSAACLGMSHAVHPSIVHSPQGFHGYRFWMAYTPICPSESSENPHIAVSNDGIRWQSFTIGNDTLTNPLFEPSQFNATHLSDPDLLLVQQQRLWLVFRVTWEIAGADSHAVFVTSTTDGLDWDDTTRIISDGLMYPGKRGSYMSPSIIINSDGSYSIFLVEPSLAGSAAGLDTSRVLMYSANNPASVWSLVDTCALYASSDSIKIWHLDITDIYGETLVALLTETPNAPTNKGDSAELYLAVSDDQGLSWTTGAEPVITWKNDITAWDGRRIYRSSGYWLDIPDRLIMGLYYSASGWLPSAWQTGLSHIYFDTSSQPVVLAVYVDSLSNPTNLVNHLPCFSWHAADPLGVNSLQQVEIQIGTDTDWTDAEMWAVESFELAERFITYNGLPLQDGTTYYLRLRLHNELAWSDWHHANYRMNTAPSAPQPLGPLGDAVVQEVPRLWVLNTQDHESDSLSYSFAIWADPAFKEPGLIGIEGVAEGDDSTSCEIAENWQDNWRYIWQSRAFDGYEYSSWSASVSFWVDATGQTPAMPQAILPHGGTAFNMIPTFEWSECTDPDPLDTVRYHLEIAMDPQIQFAISIDSLLASDYTLSDSLAFGMHYWWRVTAFDRYGLTAASNITDFWTWTLGDIDNSHEVDISDLTSLVDCMFGGDVCPDPLFVGDIDGSCTFDISDLTYMVSYLFGGGPAPAIGCMP